MSLVPRLKPDVFFLTFSSGVCDYWFGYNRSNELREGAISSHDAQSQPRTSFKQPIRQVPVQERER